MLTRQLIFGKIKDSISENMTICMAMTLHICMNGNSGLIGRSTKIIILLVICQVKKILTNECMSLCVVIGIFFYNAP